MTDPGAMEWGSWTALEALKPCLLACLTGLVNGDLGGEDELTRHYHAVSICNAFISLLTVYPDEQGASSIWKKEVAERRLRAAGDLINILPTTLRPRCDAGYMALKEKVGKEEE